MQTNTIKVNGKSVRVGRDAAEETKMTHTVRWQSDREQEFTETHSSEADAMRAFNAPLRYRSSTVQVERDGAVIATRQSSN